MRVLIDDLFEVHFGELALEIKLEVSFFLRVFAAFRGIAAFPVVEKIREDFGVDDRILELFEPIE